MIPRNKITLKSIAKDLGITHTSVSNAFNNPVKVSSKLKEKILAYAKSVGYHGPNPAAKSLRTGLCGSIGIIFNDQLSYAFSDPHDIEFLRGISTVCEEEGSNLVLVPLKHSNLQDFEAIDAMVDGYILNAPYKNNITTQRALAKGLPTVVVDFNSPEHISILTNDTEMMYEITEHLLSLGHKKIAIITFPVHENSHELFKLSRSLDTDNYVVNQRLKGCQQAFKKSNIKVDCILVQETSNNEQGGAEAAKALLALDPNITAFICLSDSLAYGAMLECQNQKKLVPERISITGFDDIQPKSIHMTFPTLTTVRQDAYEKGRKAAEALLKPKQNKSKRINIKARMIIKDSTTKIGEL
ncbi:MAG: substrate-binding domain-containing protein [Colwellia sp.]